MITPTVRDMWVVQVAVSQPATPSTDTPVVERWTAVDIDPDDPTPGVYPWMYERGVLRRDSAHGGWWADRRTVTARNDDDAFAQSAALYDAAVGFLQLQLPSSSALAPTAVTAPAIVTVQIGDERWNFPLGAEPSEARRLLDCARGAHASRVTGRLWFTSHPCTT